MNALLLALVVAVQPAPSAPPLPAGENWAPLPEAQVQEGPAASRAAARLRAPSAEVAAPAEGASQAPRETGFSVQMAAHLGLLQVDLQVGRFYAFAAGNIGIPLLTDGQVGAVTGGLGYTFALQKSAQVAWYMDLLAVGNFMWLGQRPMGGFGAAMGFRMVHASGFTMGFKIPALGGEIGSGGGTQLAVAYFFLANAIALPVFSLGYRF